MNRTERLTTIIEIVAETGRVEVDELVARLGISAATARRDLDTLAEQQLVARTHGGAIRQSVAYDLPIRYKQQQQPAEKERIAAGALALVVDGDVIGLSGGTTTTAIAAALCERGSPVIDGTHSITVVTNAINIAAALVVRPRIKTVVTGGVVHSHSYELAGPYADLVLQNITLTLAFISANAVNSSGRAFVHNESEARVNGLMAERAGRAVLVADSSKIGRSAFASVGQPGTFRTLITDGGITAAQLAELRAAGMEVIVV